MYKFTLETIGKLDENKVIYDLLLHLYTFGPKYDKRNDENRKESEDGVRKIIYDEYGTECPIHNIRMVRNVHNDWFQYCVDIAFKSNDNPPSKKRKKE